MIQKSSIYFWRSRKNRGRRNLNSRQQKVKCKELVKRRAEDPDARKILHQLEKEIKVKHSRSLIAAEWPGTIMLLCF